VRHAGELPRGAQGESKEFARTYRIGEIFLQQKNRQSAALEFFDALKGDLDPKWTEVWSHVNLGKMTLPDSVTVR
jgi:hypothetical protein